MATTPPSDLFPPNPLDVPADGAATEPSERAHADGAWVQLMKALGLDLSGGIERAEAARRRIARMRH